MKKSYIIIIIIVLIAVAFLIFGMGKKVEAPVEGTPSSVDDNQGAVREFVVTGKNFSFTPNVLTIKKGDKVKITFKNDNGFHNLIIDEFGVATKTIQGGTQDSVEFVADKTGNFQYYCSVGTHRAMGMWGTLKVE